MSSGRRRCFLLTEMVQISFLLPRLCPGGQGKFMSECLFGARPERSFVWECLLQMSLGLGRGDRGARKECRQWDLVWLWSYTGCCSSKKQMFCPWTKGSVMPSLWGSFEELVGCLHCWHDFALRSLGASQHCSQEGPRETRSSCLTLHVHMGSSVCTYSSSLGENSRAKL